ncbi:MAG: metallophosphoesterase [Spirochaetales bacterium]|nr:metallophosphoesterase [Spirochaetales bacterium]
MNITSELVRKAAKVLGKNGNRPTDRKGRPGGLIDLSNDKRDVVVIGDLHGAYDNLIKIMEHEGNAQDVKTGKTIIIIIGDGIHNDQTGQMLEMQSSLLVLEEIIHLILTYGDGVLYIRGNHDTFEDRLSKSGIQQGKEFRIFLEEHRGDDYIDAVEEFFETLPLFIIGNGYVITHAGPVRGGCSREELINILDDKELYHQLIWNRLHEFRGNPSLKEYGESDIRDMLRTLKLPENLPFIVGHNPMWHTGDRTGIWRDIIGIKNHFIIYSNIATRGPYLKISKGGCEEKFAFPNKVERFCV